MKPFDLKKALAGEPVVTRDGRKVIQLAYFEKSKTKPVLALIEGNDRPYAYNNNGLWLGEDSKSNSDLFMAPVKREGWVNVYTDSSPLGFYIGAVFPSEKEALSRVNFDSVYVKTQKIEVEI